MELTNSLHIHENGIRASTNQTYLYLENDVSLPQSQDNLVESFENMQIIVWILNGSFCLKENKFGECEMHLAIAGISSGL